MMMTLATQALVLGFLPNISGLLTADHSLNVSTILTGKLAHLHLAY